MSANPKSVRLTEDYLNFVTGNAYEVGTVLIRSPHGTGQYSPEGTPLGGWCISHFEAIREICEIIEP